MPGVEENVINQEAETQQSVDSGSQNSTTDTGEGRDTVQPDQEHSSIKIPSRGVEINSGQELKQDNSQESDADKGTTTEPNGQSSTEPGSETTNTDTNTNTDTDQAQGSASTEGNEGSETAPSFDFSELSKEIDLDFTDADGLKGILSEYKTLKTNAEEFESISPLMKEAIKAEKAGMDVNQFLGLSSRDFDQMDGKDLLREKYLKENAQLFKDNPDFAKKRFEREYASKYGLLNKQFEDDDERADWEEENAEELSYSRMELDHETKLAREDMNKWKAELTKVPEQAQSKNELSPEAQADLHSKYQDNVQKFLNEFKGLEVALDKQTTPFRYGTSEDVKKTLQESLADPSKFLESIGFTDEGIDVAKFGNAAMKFQNFEKAVQNAAQYLVEQKNKQTVEGRLEHPRNPDNVNNSSPQIKSLDEKLAEAFQAKRQQSRGGY